VERYFAFLRGVNLGPNRRIKNEELRAVLEGLGFERVAPFRTSGNVAFDAGKGSEEALRRKIEAGLGESFGFEVTVFLRGAAEIAAILAARPFDAKAIEASKGKVQVSLLMKKPTSAARRKALALATEDDLLAVEGRELYWLPGGGISESTLDLKALEAAIGLDTRRTMGTIEQMAAKYLPT
jgi:uncharacterized protein (DUF1697 family)